MTAATAAANVTVKNLSTLDAATFTLTVSSTFTLQSGSTFKQGGTVQTQPGVTRVFDANSTYIFNGAQTSISAPGNFGNLTWSSTANASPGTNLTISGNLTLLNSLQLRGSTGTTARSHTVAGNVVIDGASAVLVGTNAAATPNNGVWTISGSVTTQNGGILRGNNPSSGATGTFNIAGNVVNNGSIEHGTGAGLHVMNFNGSSAQTVSGSGPATLQDFTVSNAAGVTMNSALTWTGAGTVNSGTSLAAGAALTNSGTLSVSGSLQRNNGGSFAGTAPTYTATSTLIYNDSGPGSVAPGIEWGSGGVVGSGVPQNVTVSAGTVKPTVSRTAPGNLTLSGGTMVLAGGDVTIGGTLGLGSAVADAGSNKYIANGAVTRTSGYVTGNLQKPVAAASAFTFEVGANSNYSPVVVKFASIGGAGNLTASATAPSGAPPGASGLSSTKYVNRSWTLTNGGIASPNYDATFNFLNPGDLVGGASPGNLRIGKNTSGTWSQPGVFSFTSTSVRSALGQTSFSDFILAECPDITVAMSKTDITCFGANDGTATAAASGGTGPYTYTWTPSGSGASLTALGPGTYTVTATDANGCTGTNSVTINEPPAPALSLSKTDITCFGAGNGTVTATFSGGTGAFMVQIDGAGYSTQTSPYTFTALGSGSHTVDLKDANSCATSQSITVNEPPALALSLSKTDITCFGAGDGTVTATFSGGTGAFMVQIDGAGYSTQSSPYIFTALGPGSHTVDLKDANNCATSQSITVNDAPAILLSLSATDITCFGANDGKVTATFSGGTGTLEVRIDGGIYSAQTSPYTFTGLGQGSHTVDVKDANGCVKTLSTPVNEPTQLVVTATPASPTVCTGGSTMVTVSATGGTTPYSGTGSFSQSAGTTTYTVTDANGCMASKDVTISEDPGTVTVDAITDPQTVEEKSNLFVGPTATQSPCASGSLTWSISPALPAGADFNTTFGTIKWTPNCGEVGNYGPFTITATATSGAFGNSNAFTIQVTHKAGTVAVDAISDPQTVAEGSPLTITPSVTLGDCATGPVTWSVAPTLPDGASFSTSTGEIMWTPSCLDAGNYGPFTLTATAATAEVGSSNAFAIQVTDVPTSVGQVTSVAASQVLSGNPAGQTTGIKVTFFKPPASPGNPITYSVYRAPFGSYPEYDDAGGVAPTQPTTWPPAAPWTLTTLTTTGQTDHPGTRDFWYYVVYAKNKCGDYSVASTMTDGNLDYHLGDVSDGITPGTGDNLVQGVDMSALGAYYGQTLVPSDPFNYLDVGPTTTNYVDGRPTTDNKVNFEDLVLFAINFDQVSAPTLATAKPADGTSLVASAADRLVLYAPATVTMGQTLRTPITMEGTGNVQAISIHLAWNPTVVRPVGQQAGALLFAQDGLALSAAAGSVDVAALGHGLIGSGELASVNFEVIGNGDPGIRIETIDARDTKNQAITVNTSRAVPTPELPTVTQLQMTGSNPSRQSVAFAVSLAEQANVDLSIYAVDGRRVAVLMSGTREPGVTSVTWDGRDENGRAMSSGVYYARMTAGAHVFKRTISFLR